MSVVESDRRFGVDWSDLIVTLPIGGKSENWRGEPRDPRTGKWIRMGAEIPALRSDLRTPHSPGHEDLTLLHQPWSPPPKPKGTFVGRGGAGGFTSDGAATSLTESGRIGEAAFQRLTGGTLMHPPGKGEMSPLDVEWDGYAFEVKAVWTDSSRFAAWPKPHEIESKLAEAERLGKKAALSLVVMDRETNLAKIYYRDGLHGGRLSESKGWKFMGEVQLTISELESAAHMAANPNG